MLMFYFSNMTKKEPSKSRKHAKNMVGSYGLIFFTPPMIHDFMLLIFFIKIWSFIYVFNKRRDRCTKIKQMMQHCSTVQHSTVCIINKGSPDLTNLGLIWVSPFFKVVSVINSEMRALIRYKLFSARCYVDISPVWCVGELSEGWEALVQEPYRNYHNYQRWIENWFEFLSIVLYHKFLKIHKLDLSCSRWWNKCSLS